ncbi:MAG: hypothetical protein IVW36_01380 [Dehalococcoidia bacterium]|nr:hypothetical protein [Dehalococcoidia bacterium]
MGLLKKKPTSELDATAAAAMLPASDPARSALAAEPTSAGPAADSPAAADDAGGAIDAGSASESRDADADEGAPDEPSADAAVDLLSMFGSTGHEADDRGLLLSLAGEIEIADLMDEVQTVAAALNIAAGRG